MNGAIFFFAPLLACLCSDSITLTALAASSFRVGGGGLDDFFLSPCPLPSALLCLRASINPPPAGSGDARAGWRFAAAGETAICLLLIMSCRSLAWRSFAFVLPAVLVFISRLALLPLFAVGSCLSASGPVISSPMCSPVPCVSYGVLAFRPVSSVGFGRLVVPCPPVLVLTIACGWAGRPIGAVPCFAPSASVCRLSSPLRLVSRPAVPRRSPPRSSVCLLLPFRSRAAFRAVCRVSPFSPSYLS